MMRDLARLVLLAGAAVGAYSGVARLGRQPVQAAVVVGLVLLAVAVERLWAFVRWMSPLRGQFGEPDQEIALLRAIERELSRSLRHDAPLTVVALRGRRGLKTRAVAAMLRTSDIVIRGRGRHIVVLMTETARDNARLVIERMVERLPISAVAIADHTVITPGAQLSGFGARHQARQTSIHGPTLALARGLQLGLFRAEARARRGRPAPIYDLSAADVLAATTTHNRRSMDDLTQRVA